LFELLLATSPVGRRSGAEIWGSGVALTPLERRLWGSGGRDEEFIGTYLFFCIWIITVLIGM